MNPNLQARRKVILGGCTLLFIFSVIDGVLTIWGLDLQFIEEANPLMQSFIRNYPMEVMIVKAALPVILGLLSWRIWHRSYRFITYALKLLLIVYVIVMMVHVRWIIVYLRMNWEFVFWNGGFLGHL